MAVDMPSRQDKRDRIKAILDADGTWQAVYDHQPKSFGGQSPVATVHSGPVRTIEEAFGERKLLQIGIIVTNLVKRDDAAMAEDTLDALLEKVVQLMADNQSDAEWEYVEIEDTLPDYVTVDGVEYRAEIIPLWPTIFMV